MPRQQYCIPDDLPHDPVSDHGQIMVQCSLFPYSRKIPSSGPIIIKGDMIPCHLSAADVKDSNRFQKLLSSLVLGKIEPLDSKDP